MDDKTLKFFVDEFDGVKQEIRSYKEEINGFKDSVYDKMDAVYKEVLAMRQEQSMHIGSHIRVDEELDDQKKKLEKLESKRAVV